jgi:hypothetical protein
MPNFVSNQFYVGCYYISGTLLINELKIMMIVITLATRMIYMLHEHKHACGTQLKYLNCEKNGVKLIVE